MVKSKKNSLIFRIFALIVSTSGIISSCVKPGVGLVFSPFRFYTIQSNFLAVILFALLTYKAVANYSNPKIGISFYPRFEMICAVDLLLTLIVYWVLLAPTSFSMGTESDLFNLYNLTVHLFTPLLCLADYILFTKKGELKYSDVYMVTIYPLLYVMMVSIMGFSGHVYSIDRVDGLPIRFPYFFLDFDRLGWQVLMNIGGLVVFFLVISHIFYFADRKAGKEKNPNQ